MNAPHKMKVRCFLKEIGVVCRGAIFAAVLLFAVSGTVFEVSAGDAGQPGYRLTEQWQTPRELRVPESILYNAREEILYVTDMSPENSAIYRLHDGKLAVWLKNDAISQPNGLHMEKGRLVVGNSGDGTIKAVDLSTRVITSLARVGSGIDGLRPDGRGNYFVSDWQGKTSLVTAAGDVIVLMDTTAAKINSADLEYVEKRKLLLIPTFFDNRVVAYRVSN
jgi:sugar lactone lactonase YvrE